MFSKVGTIVKGFFFWAVIFAICAGSAMIIARLYIVITDSKDRLSLTGILAAIAVAIGSQWWQFVTAERRLKVDRQNMVRVVGWRIYADLVALRYMVASVVAEFDKYLADEPPPSMAKLSYHRFKPIEVPDSLNDEWKDFRYFSPAICTSLAQTMGIVSTYTIVLKALPKGQVVDREVVTGEREKLVSTLGLIDDAVKGLDGVLDGDLSAVKEAIKQAS